VEIKVSILINYQPTSTTPAEKRTLSPACRLMAAIGPFDLAERENPS
jgi:hypothetical protein